MSSDLYMVRLVLNRRAVLRVGVRHQLGQAADDGALLHAGLSQLFAQSSERAKVPFLTFAVDDTSHRLLRQPDLLFLLAYASMDEAALTAAMGPARNDLVLRCETRHIPRFQAGQQLGFRIRVCPVTRTRNTGSRATSRDRHGRAKHRELDAFVHATLTVPSDTRLEREDVYARWLDRQVQQGGACTFSDVRLTEFGLKAMRRQGDSRVVRPNAVLEGSLSIAEPEQFTDVLARGIGRHRAFGFGMLLLRPLGP